jgi:hypothetical protein
MQPATATPKPATADQPVERAPGGASFSEFKLTFDDKAA